MWFYMWNVISNPISGTCGQPRSAQSGPKYLTAV